jgi:apolipoprotein N-acyltransferase
MWTASRLKPGRAFLAGWGAGFIWFFISYNWVAHSISNYGGIVFPMDRAVIVLLAGIHALYVGIFAIFVPPEGRPMTTKTILLLPSIWILLELARSWYPAPFPWLLLGNSFWRTPLLSPLYSLMGVYGASFYIVLFNVYAWKTATRGKMEKRLSFAIPVMLILLPVLGALALGPGNVGSLTVGIVQGNFDQDLKWEEELKDETIRTYLELTDKAVKRGARLVVWPESAVPVFYQAEPELAQRLREYAHESDIHLVFGSPGYEILDGQILLYNRAYHLGPDSSEEYYDKVQLVPFGEYVPLNNLIPFVDRMVPGEGEFARGSWSGPFNTPIPSGLLICYEITFPSLGRREVQDGSRILINITNDAWFGRSWGPYQHLAVASVRAVENGVPVIRAANTGISAVIDHRGRIKKALPLDVRDIIIAEVETGANRTVYSRLGDWIVMVTLVVIIINIYSHVRSWRVKNGADRHI